MWVPDTTINNMKTTFLAFVDITKAFDLVDQKALFTVLAKTGCPPILVALIRSFHDGMFAKVQFDGHLSEAFPIKKGVKQGCVLAPMFFGIYFLYLIFFSKQYMLTWIRMLVCLCFLKMMVASSTWHNFLDSKVCCS